VGSPTRRFRPGDGDKACTRSLRRANAKPEPGQATPFSEQADYVHSNAVQRLVADAWCAAFAWPKTLDAPPAIVNRVLLDLRERGAEGILSETACCPSRRGERSTAARGARSSGSPQVRVLTSNAQRAWPSPAFQRCARTCSSRNA
jgi:hypothetical protein